MKYKASKTKIELAVRVAKYNDAIWYDLGKKDFVKIDTNGWAIHTPPQPLIFRRFKHQKEQVYPEQGGNIDEFLDLINVANSTDRFLLKIYLVVALIPGFPHPVLSPNGPQGSAKTTACKLIKDVIDPSNLDTTSIDDDRDLQNLFQTVSHNWLVVLDNLSHLSNKASDTIARICSGSGISKRKLYTNDEDFISHVQRILILNGINQVIKKADLLDRSILLNLERIPNDRRITDIELKNRYQNIKPKLMGALFDAVSGALREYDSINLLEYPRMADFAKYGCAVAKYLEKTPRDFTVAYQINIGKQNDEAIEANPVAAVIIQYMQDKEIEKCSPSELYTKLLQVATELNVEHSEDWPNGPIALWKKIQEVVPNLEAASIKVSRDDRSYGRVIVLRRLVLTEDTDTVQKSPTELGLDYQPKDSSDSRDSPIPF